MIPKLAELAYYSLSHNEKVLLKSEYSMIIKPLQCCESYNTCSLWSLKCCSCADKRPFSEVYKCYTDGYGMVETKDRNLHYCPVCKFKNIKKLKTQPPLRRSKRLQRHFRA